MGSADILIDLGKNFTVRKAADFGVTQGNVHLAGNRFAQRFISSSTNNSYAFVVHHF
jgi:hypothetical protein